MSKTQKNLRLMKEMLSGFIHHVQYNQITDFHKDDHLKIEKALVCPDEFNFKKSPNCSDFLFMFFQDLCSLTTNVA